MKIMFLIAFFATVAALSADPSRPQADSSVKTLQQELLKTLKEAAELSAEQVKSARAMPLEALEAQQAYLNAVVDVAETRQDKIDTLLQLVNLLKQMEAVSQASFESARSTYAEVLKARAARIKAEIGLEKARVAPGDQADANGEKQVDRQARIKQLQKERLDALQDLVETTTALVNHARMFPAEARQALQELLEAQLEYAPAGPERTAILKQIVDSHRKMEEAAQALRQSGRATEVDVLRAKAARLKAEIAVQREAAVAGN